MNIPCYIICVDNNIWGLSPRRFPDPYTSVEVDRYLEQFNLPNHTLIPVREQDLFAVTNAYSRKALTISNGSYTINT